MDLKDFMTLSSEEKYLSILEDGIYVSGRRSNELTYNLYSIFCFYAEICFNLADNCIEEVNVLTEIDQLNPYLEDIQLPLLGLV